MCCTPSISIVAQSVSMAVILPPEMRPSSRGALPQTRIDVAQMPERDAGMAVYGEGHSRPAQPHGNFDLDRA